MTRRRLSNQSGMSLIEVSVTILIIAVGTLATLGTYVHFSKASRKARERAVLISVAQREMESLRPVSFAKLGLTTAPASGATTEAPLAGDAASEPVVTGGVVRPGGDDFLYRGVYGRIYRYVTKRDQVCTNLTAKIHGQLSTLFAQTTSAVSASIPNLCGTGSPTKRLTVIVVPTKGSGAAATNEGYRLTTIVQDPTGATPVAVNTAGLAVKRAVAVVAGAPTPAASTTTTQTVTLTDTRCSATGRTTPSSHQTGDTSQAGFTCSPSGPAPTLLTLGAPGGSTSDPVEDFSTEVTRAATGGLAMLRDSVAGSCASPTNLIYTNAEADSRRSAIHTWATTIPAGPLETPDSGGRASLTLWSSTVDARQAPGRLCVTLRRASNGALLGSSDFSLASWPSTPTELVTAFDLDHVSIPSGERLLLTLRVPQDSGSDIRILYDHAKYQSTLAFTMKNGKTLQ